MGDLAEDTEVSGSNGNYKARLSRDWEIWGPNGGYVAAIALRAAGAHSSMPRPASFSCHFLSVARFEDVELKVTTMRATKRAESVRVSMTQDGKPVVEAIAWLVTEGEGLVHDHATMPDVAGPDGLPFLRDLLPADAPGAPFKFWNNFDEKPLNFIPMEQWETREPGEPVFRSWFRFSPTPTFDDPVVDAARSVILLDTMSWPSATRAHPPRTQYMAPTLDVAVQFHRSDPGEEWLLADGVAPVAEDSLIGFRSHTWNPKGQLLASAGGQMLCRRVPPPG